MIFYTLFVLAFIFDAFRDGWMWEKIHPDKTGTRFGRLTWHPFKWLSLVLLFIAFRYYWIDYEHLLAISPLTYGLWRVAYRWQRRLPLWEWDINITEFIGLQRRLYPYGSKVILSFSQSAEYDDWIIKLRNDKCLLVIFLLILISVIWVLRI